MTILKLITRKMEKRMNKLKRKSGILLHITSLPNANTWGRFSYAAYEFIDFLSDGNFKIWQTLPFTDCLYENSPYSALSSFAINPYFLNIEDYLNEDEIREIGFNKNNDRQQEYEKFNVALDRIYNKCRNNFDTTTFEKDNKYWLEDYAMFKVMKNKFDNLPWNELSNGLKNRVKSDLDHFRLKYKKEIDQIVFIQYLLDNEWKKIKKYANDRNIDIFGDVPFYVEFDSAEVWANPKNWQIENNKPKMVAGVPPDYFNEDGQLWGNPLYNYEVMAKNKYDFWAKRIKRLSELFDIIRIDHFVAFSRYWAIPANSTSAKKGKWVKGAGESLLKVITKSCKSQLVAEDLGIITEDVSQLKDKFGLAGIKVMQFAFDGIGDNLYKPHNYEKNCVAYLGTHDNDTFMGMLSEGNWDKINRFKRYFNLPLEYGNDAVIDAAILALYKSSADTIILTAQDILKLGKESRMNVPGVPVGNWTWQLNENIDRNLTSRYRELAELYGR